jgi:predicted permease
VISDALWRNIFGGQSDVLGRMVRLDGTPYQIVGVMPPEFGFPHKTDLSYGNGHTNTTQIWVPYGLTPQQKADRDSFLGYTVARLKPGVTAAGAQAEMSAILTRLNRLHHENTQGLEAYVKPFRENVVGAVRPLMWLLLSAVGLVLLIACGNAANLLLARAANRTHEFSVRATLGARRGRLLRQMLTESLMLSVIAGALGVGLAYVFLHALLRLDPGDIPRMQDAGLDVRVLLFTVGVTVLTSMLFGVLPALAATRVHLVGFLKSSGMRGVVGERRHVRDGLAIAQIALVVVLLTGAGLLLRSYAKLMAVPTGFSASTISVNVQFTSQYNDGSQKPLAFFRELTERMKNIPGVEAAGAIHTLPLSNTESLARFEVEGYQNDKNQLVEARGITGGYLSTMQIALKEGRNFTESEGMERSSLVLVNEAFARKYFDGASAIGRHIHIPLESGNSWATVVGVVDNVRNMDMEAAAVPQIYIPLSWYSDLTEGYLVVRSMLPKDAVVADIRSVMKEIDSNLAIGNIHTMGDLVSQATARRRFQTTLLTVFSGIAMLLAVVGVYGLLAYSVRQRTGEIGLRMALGSSKAGVIRLVLREGLSLLGIGLLLGLAAAFAFTRLLTGFLYDVPPIDPFTFALVPILLFIATLVACFIPSWRAATVDPINALRHE